MIVSEPVRRLLPALVLLALASSARAEIPVDLSGYRESSQVAVRHESSRLSISWPISNGEQGRLSLDLRAGARLIATLGIAPAPEADERSIFSALDPVTFLTIGTRENPDPPPGMSVFNVFFDNPAKRPYATFRSKLDLKNARVVSDPGRATVILDGLSAGPFAGALEITVYAGARLIHVESVLSTKEHQRAFTYDAGLVSSSLPWSRIAWIDTEGKLTREALDPNATDKPRAVKHRAIVAETLQGSIAAFPPPHQYFYPRDYTDNQKTVWAGRNHRGLDDISGFGIRQTETGGGNFAPWFSAPPGTPQRLGVFYLLSSGKAEDALAEVLKFTNGDRFPSLPGHVTFTSHWHMAVTAAAMKEEAEGKKRSTPDFVKMFKEMNVQAIHLAEFHGDGHPQDPGPLRLPEMAAMFAECRRLSDGQTLYLPGEEANFPLSVKGAGKETGHWLYLFPRPVTFTMRRAPGQPFEETEPKLGPIYHLGGRDDMIRLLEREHGLAWTAHPRIKSSNWTPDAYRDEAFYRSPLWLGAAWKAMPADLSRPRLGRRVLDLMDDMANWGQKKYVPGEVDVFKVDHTHELYGHMNVNYLKLDRLPRFNEDWTSILDTLRNGRFFVTTGEVLLTDFTAAGVPSGSTLKLADDAPNEVKLTLRWTFPLKFAEVVSGDGEKVYRERIDLSDTPPFGEKTISRLTPLKARKWVRVEAWDVAANGAFSQPVWIDSQP